MRMLGNDEMTFTMTATFDDNLINDLLGIDAALSNFSISYATKVQAKKHRKWRTNKKWLKRYGYKEVVVESDGWHIKESGEGMVTFEKEME